VTYNTFCTARLVIGLAMLACSVAPSIASARGPRFPFRLPNQADAERCLAARAKAVEAINRKDWAEAAKEFRAAIDAFPDSQSDWYNLGCILATSGDHDAAFDALNRARDVGKMYVYSVVADPDLEPLHGHPEWGEFLRSLSSTPPTSAMHYGADELAQSREEMNAVAEETEESLAPLERALFPQYTVAIGEVALWKAASLQAMASRASDSTERDRLRWEAFRGLVDERMNPASEYLVTEVLRYASSPEMAASAHWIDVAQVLANARWGAAVVNAATEEERNAATARRRGDLLEIAASVGDQPALAGLLTRLTWESVDNLPLSIRFYRRLMAVAADPVSARKSAQELAPGTVLAADGLPTFRATTTSGTVLSNATLKGHWTLLDAWATWCRPCLTALPTLRAWYEAHRAQGLVMIGLALEDGPTKDPATFAQWCAEHQVGWPQVLDTGPDEVRVSTALGITSMPQLLLIDPAGRVVAAGNSLEHVRPALEQAIAAEQRGKGSERDATLTMPSPMP
jgi:thiol-disulfide isomerase/thioredoxin